LGFHTKPSVGTAIGCGLNLAAQPRRRDGVYPVTPPKSHPLGGTTAVSSHSRGAAAPIPSTKPPRSASSLRAFSPPNHRAKHISGPWDREPQRPTPRHTRT
jgi:hypothetical protein